MKRASWISIVMSAQLAVGPCAFAKTYGGTVPLSTDLTSFTSDAADKIGSEALPAQAQNAEAAAEECDPNKPDSQACKDLQQQLEQIPQTKQDQAQLDQISADRSADEPAVTDSGSKPNEIYSEQVDPNQQASLSNTQSDPGSLTSPQERDSQSSAPVANASAEDPSPAPPIEGSTEVGKVSSPKAATVTPEMNPSPGSPSSHAAGMTPDTAADTASAKAASSAPASSAGGCSGGGCGGSGSGSSGESSSDSMAALLGAAGLAAGITALALSASEDEEPPPPPPPQVVDTTTVAYDCSLSVPGQPPLPGCPDPCVVPTGYAPPAGCQAAVNPADLAPATIPGSVNMAATPETVPAPVPTDPNAPVPYPTTTTTTITSYEMAAPIPTAP